MQPSPIRLLTAACVFATGYAVLTQDDDNRKPELLEIFALMMLGDAILYDD